MYSVSEQQLVEPPVSPLLELQNHIGAYYMRAPLLIQAFQVSHMRTTTCGLRLRIFVAYKYLYYVV